MSSGHWRTRVRVRVTASATVVSLLGALVGSVLFVASLHQNLEGSLLASAHQQADTVEAQLRAGSDPQDVTVSSKNDLIIQIVDADGTVTAGDHDGLTSPIRTTPGTSEGVTVWSLDDTYAVYAKESDGKLILVGLSEEQVTQATRTAVLLLAVGVPLGIALIALVVWLAIGRALRPVEVMRREAAAITSDDLHRRLAVPPGDDEIPLLASTLNQMLETIDMSQRQQRQFVSDASHELRSPLAVVRQIAEVARRHPETTSVERLADDVLAEELRMEGLVRALLTLARLDDRASVRARVVDLDDEVLQAVDRIRTRGSSADLDISRVSSGQVYGDPVLFGQLVTNLLSNAVRHATSRVTIALKEHDDHVVLTVEDDGEGIREEDRARIFDRFVRLDDARDRDHGGTGLGLAIVSKVVEDAQGEVRVEASDTGGARFTVRLPAADAQDPDRC